MGSACVGANTTAANTARNGSAKRLPKVKGKSPSSCSDGDSKPLKSPRSRSASASSPTSPAGEKRLSGVLKTPGTSGSGTKSTKTVVFKTTQLAISRVLSLEKDERLTKLQKEAGLTLTEVSECYKVCQTLPMPPEKHMIISFLRENGIGEQISRWIVEKMLPKVNSGLHKSFCESECGSPRIPTPATTPPLGTSINSTPTSSIKLRVSTIPVPEIPLLSVKKTDLSEQEIFDLQFTVCWLVLTVLNALNNSSVHEQLSFFFDLFDLNGDGALQFDELMLFVKALHEQQHLDGLELDIQPELIVTLLIHEADENGDGCLSYEEVMTHYKFIAKKLRLGWRNQGESSSRLSARSNTSTTPRSKKTPTSTPRPSSGEKT
ncbi:hypothetical protein Pelo_1176 [Pelomyxa schiedti]|nr:hypothetical protein Pelo_1176 [Pelomyxa schiedti]